MSADNPWGFDPTNAPPDEPDEGVQPPQAGTSTPTTTPSPNLAHDGSTAPLRLRPGTTPAQIKSYV